MSLTTWKEEFYPVTAGEAVESGQTVEELIQHSLTKWIGLRRENIDKHKVALIEGGVNDLKKWFYGRLNIDNENCSLCQLSQKTTNGSTDCSTCYIVLMTGKACCNNPKVESSGEWIEWEDSEDPEPMIALLEKTLKLYQESKNEKG